MKAEKSWTLKIHIKITNTFQSVLGLSLIAYKEIGAHRLPRNIT